MCLLWSLEIATRMSRLIWKHAKYWTTGLKTNLNYCLKGQILFMSVFIINLYFSISTRFRFVFFTSIRIIFRWLGVLIREETRALLTVCPRHRETYRVGWGSGKTRCSILSKMAGHKSSAAKGDRAVSSNESAFVLSTTENFSSSRNAWVE